jgi:hypothetical protein
MLACAAVCDARHEWFQSDSHVVVSVFAKNTKPADVAVTFTQDTVRSQQPVCL